MKEFTGKDLIEFVENYPQLQFLPIKYLFIELLKKNLIIPSDIIDAYSQVMQDKLKVARSHYEDACVTALQMNSGNFNKGEDKKKMMDRFLYNASFSKSSTSSSLYFCVISLDITASRRGSSSNAPLEYKKILERLSYNKPRESSEIED